MREGQEVTLELEFSLTYSPRDAVGYVDGYMVIVEGGRQHLGKRRKVRITETARTGARATVVKPRRRRGSGPRLTRDGSGSELLSPARLAIISCRCLLGVTNDEVR